MPTASAIHIITLTAFLCYASVRGSCPGGWHHFNESCYNFVAKERSWTSAEVDCIRHGSKLVQVETIEENEFLTAYLTNNSRTFYGFDMWIGGSKDSEGLWTWVDGTPMQETDHDDWQVGQPDSPPQDGNFCLEMESDYGYQWNDDYCDEINFSICERPYHPLTPPPPSLVG